MSTNRPKGQSLAVLLLLVALLAPALLLVAVCGARLGVWSAEFSLGVLALKIGRILACLLMMGANSSRTLLFTRRACRVPWWKLTSSSASPNMHAVDSLVSQRAAIAES